MNRDKIAEYYTQYYPGKNTYDSSTAPIYNWKQVVKCVVNQGDRFYIVDFKFHPRKQTLELKKRSIRNLKLIGGVRVTVELH